MPLAQPPTPTTYLPRIRLRRRQQHHRPPPHFDLDTHDALPHPPPRARAGQSCLGILPSLQRIPCVPIVTERREPKSSRGPARRHTPPPTPPPHFSRRQPPDLCQCPPPPTPPPPPLSPASRTSQGKSSLGKEGQLTYHATIASLRLGAFAIANALLLFAA